MIVALRRAESRGEYTCPFTINEVLTALEAIERKRLEAESETKSTYDSRETALTTIARHHECTKALYKIAADALGWARKFDDQDRIRATTLPTLVDDLYELRDKHLTMLGDGETSEFITGVCGLLMRALDHRIPTCAQCGRNLSGRIHVEIVDLHFCDDACANMPTAHRLIKESESKIATFASMYPSVTREWKTYVVNEVLTAARALPEECDACSTQPGTIDLCAMCLAARRLRFALDRMPKTP